MCYDRRAQGSSDGAGKLVHVPALRAVCDYCGEVYGSMYSVSCHRDEETTRQQCLLALLQDLQELRSRIEA